MHFHPDETVDAMLFPPLAQLDYPLVLREYFLLAHISPYKDVLRVHRTRSRLRSAGTIEIHQTEVARGDDGQKPAFPSTEQMRMLKVECEPFGECRDLVIAPAVV